MEDEKADERLRYQDINLAIVIKITRNERKHMKRCNKHHDIYENIK